MSFSVMFLFCAYIALVRRRQTTIAITFRARIKRSPVVQKSNQPQRNGCRFFAFHDYRSLLSRYKRRLALHLFSLRNHLARLQIATKECQYPVRSDFPAQKRIWVLFIFFLTVKLRKSIPSLAALQRVVKTMSNH